MSTIKTIIPTRSIAARVIEIVDAGLVSGVGRQEPGKMCVEAAVCFAFGLKHGDEPPCVGPAVRAFKIALNDSGWSSPQARAAGMRRLAVAQLGSDALDQTAFSQLLALRATQKLLPAAIRDYAQYCRDKYQPTLEEIAKQCEAAQTNKEAAASLARLDRLDSLDSLDSLDRLARLDRLDAFLISVADLGLEVLIEMESPGCEWLDLCDVATEART